MRNFGSHLSIIFSHIVTMAVISNPPNVHTKMIAMEHRDRRRRLTSIMHQIKRVNAVFVDKFQQLTYFFPFH